MADGASAGFLQPLSLFEYKTAFCAFSRYNGKMMTGFMRRTFNMLKVLIYIFL